MADNHLFRLYQISLKNFRDLIQRKPQYNIFRDRILGILLVQGAALHYIRGM